MSYRSIRLVLREDDLSKDILADVFQGEMRAVNQAVRNIYESMTEERREIICCIINNKHKHLSTVVQEEVEEAIKQMYVVLEELPTHAVIVTYPVCISRSFAKSTILCPLLDLGASFFLSNTSSFQVIFWN